MAAVFDLPVAANGFGKLLHTHLQTADEIANTDDSTIACLAVRNRDADRFQFLETNHLFEFPRQRTLNVGSPVVSTMFDFVSRLLSCCDTREVINHVFVEVLDDGIVQPALISFQRQNITVQRLVVVLGNRSLCPDGVDGDDRSIDVDEL